MFTKARVTLTAWYLVIIMLISISFSAVIYSALFHEVERFAQFQRFRIERQYTQANLHEPLPPQGNLRPYADPELVEETKIRILTVLALINAGIFVLSGIFGYILAGKTLAPIRTMVDEQNQFITDASHELRTPLTSLLTALEVHRRDTHLTLTRAKTLISGSIGDVKKLARLTDSLLALTQFQKPNDLLKDKINIPTLLSEAIKSVQGMAKAKNIRFSIHLPRTLTVSGRREELRQLFTILLDNAVKYSKNHSTVTVYSTPGTGACDIMVKDQGIGIEKKDIPHIFDRFYRADSARTKTGAAGYGLGLAIAKKIVERHAGHITCQSSAGKGSIFTVQLPLA
jgi:signal transduction histidine kinase